MRTSILILGLAALFSVSLYGCDLDGWPSEPVKVESSGPGLQTGWTRYVSKGEFTLDVPDTWLKLEVSGENLAAVLDVVSESNPDLAKYLKSSDFRRQLSGLASQGVRLLLYDKNVDLTQTLFATNLNVVRMRVPSGLKLDEVVRENIKELERVMGSGLLTTVKREYASLGGKTAEKISYSYRINLPNGLSIDADIQQYIVLRGNVQYVLTFSTSSYEMRWQADTFDAIAKTFRVLK